MKSSRRIRFAGPISGKQTPHSEGEALEQSAPERALIIWPWLAQIIRYSCSVKTIGTSPSARRAARSACTPKPMAWWKLMTSGRQSVRKRSKCSVSPPISLDPR